MYEIFFAGISLLLAVLQGCILAYLMGSFMKPAAGGRRGSRYYIVFVWTLQKMLTQAGAVKAPDSVRPLLRQLVLFMLLFLSVMLLYQGRRGFQFYLSVTFMALHEISFFLAYMIIVLGSHIYDLYLWYLLAGKLPASSEDSFLVLLTATELVLQMLQCGVFLFLLFRMVRAFVRRYREKEYEVSGTELLFLILPGLSGFLICTLLRLLVVTVKDGETVILYDSYPPLILMVPGILLVSLFSVLGSVRLLQDMIALNREKSGRLVMEQQVRSMEAHMQEMNRTYAEIRSIRHDIHNQLAVVHEMLWQGGGTEETIQELAGYLGTLDRMTALSRPGFQTGNMMADALLHMKYHEASEQIPGILIEAEDLVFPTKSCVENYDIIVILCNALDNAIEACGKLGGEEEKKIRIFSFQRGNMFFINMENSFNGRLLRKKGYEFPATDKEDGKMHGIGFLNMQASARKYHGGVDWRTEGRTFYLAVMLHIIS